MQWDINSSQIPNSAEELVKVLLSNRGIDEDQQKIFFSPRHPRDLTLEDVGIDPAEMKRAKERILKAKENKEYVVVFGDYDADGVTATAILWETLYEMGIKAMPFIPEREKHGYGISDRSLEDLLKDKKPDLIITVDNGIVAHAPLQKLKDMGIDVIVTDHHLPEVLGGLSTENEELRKAEDDLGSRSSYQLPATNYHYPPAFAIIHSTKLCGATTAWFLARELSREKAVTLLDLCAIGTIADQMILLEANRSFAFHGIAALQKTKRVGLLNLYKQANVEPANITSYTINFVIAPRINAMGRLSSALNALRALCTKDEQKSQELIHVLDQTNSERQELTWSMVEAALKKADEWKDKKIIVLSSEDYHEGVIGLIAGKLVEQFAKPAIVISQGSKMAKASSRSVKGVNIVELIRQVRADLLDVGGHPMAAGFSLESAKIKSVTAQLEQIAEEQIDTSLLTARLNIECKIDPNLISLDLCKHLKRFEPFGNGNTDPIFALENMQILQAYSIGRERKHLKLVVSKQIQADIKQMQADTNQPSNQQTVQLECIGFSLGHLEESLHDATSLDLAGTLSINEWNGRKSVQMVVKDVT